MNKFHNFSTTNLNLTTLKDITEEANDTYQIRLREYLETYQAKLDMLNMISQPDYISIHNPNFNKNLEAINEIDQNEKNALIKLTEAYNVLLESNKMINSINASKLI